MDITTSGIFFSKMSYPCHIHVISFFQKRYIWIYLVYPKLKKLHLVYTWYIFSCHMPCLSMSYPCHKFVRLSCAGSKRNSAGNCIAIRVLHATAVTAQCSSSTIRFICHRRARGLLLCPRPWVGTPPCAPADPAGAGAAGAGAGSSAGSVGGGPPVHGASWECEIVLGLSVPSLRSFLPRPGPPRSTPRR